jgi:hypothetical protein
MVDGSDETLAIVHKEDDENSIRVGYHVRILQGSSPVRAVKLARES